MLIILFYEKKRKNLKKKEKKNLKNPRKKNNIASSFRDPSGFVFKKSGTVYRQVNSVYKKDYDLLISSGLYEKLITLGYLIKHRETPLEKGHHKDIYKILQPEQLDFISYPYEWTFSMLKDAALHTLQIQKIAIEHGMSLKDASAFNIQFIGGKPTLIDTLSFEVYDEGKPWVAYKQFVEHFLAPLALSALTDIRLNRLTSVFLDGIPVELAARMLPLRSRLNLSFLIHIFAHATSQKKFSQKKLGKTLEQKKFGKRSLLGLIDNLESSIKKLQWNPKGTQWEDYYEEDKNNYISTSLTHKAELVKKYVEKIKPKMVWDMGANTGYFSRIAGSSGAQVVAFDIDYGAVEKNYQQIKTKKETNILPLFSDLTNPTPSLGWENKERLSLFERAPADAILALALIHHLAIPHNVPFSYLASCFARLGRFLIVEFIDKQDSQVQILLANRKDIFDKYSQKHFEEDFKEFFTIKQATPIKGSKRVLYLMEKKS